MIALVSIGLTSFAYMAPTKMKLRAAYGFVGLTFASGFYLVWSEPAHMLESCMMGIAYLAVMSVGILATRRKLVKLAQEL